MKPLRRLLLFVGVGLSLLFIGWVVFSFYFLDDSFKEEQDYFGDIKGIEYGFRAYFHGKTAYPAYSLDQLRGMGIMDKGSYENFVAYNGHYTPFSSNTPANTVVLRFNFNWFEPDVFTKRDLTADNSAPDHFVP